MDFLGGSMLHEKQDDTNNLVQKLVELTYVLNQYDMSKQKQQEDLSHALLSNFSDEHNLWNAFTAPKKVSSPPGFPNPVELFAQSLLRDMTTSQQQDISNNNYQPSNSSSSASSSSLPSLTTESAKEISSSNNNNSNTTSAEQPVEKFQVNVPVKSSAHVSYIVGKQGAKIRQIRNETDTLIQTPVNGEEPVFVLKGRKKNVITAKERILAEAAQYDMSLLVEAMSYNDGNNRKQVNLLLPSRFIGLVVGKKGTAIKRIMELSGATVVTPKVNTLNGFKMFGTFQQIRQAVDLIKHHIEASSRVVIVEQNRNNCEIELFIAPQY